MAIEHYEAELARKDRRIQELEIALAQEKRSREKERIQFAMTDAARLEGVAETALPDVVARAIQSNQWKLDSRDHLVRTVDGATVVDASTGKPAGERQWVREQRTNAPHWWEGGQTQDKAASAAGPNPWAKDSWNLTQQGQILRDNPALARKLAAAAGAKLPEMAD